MRHRLFCSLVLSSSVLLDGCATAHAFAPDPSSDAGVGDAAPATSDAALSDPRACEPGWPTTKGIFEVVRDGLRYGCRVAEGSTPDAPDLERCCVVGPAS